jgi:hypothetical protein
MTTKVFRRYGTAEPSSRKFASPLRSFFELAGKKVGKDEKRAGFGRV